MAQSTVEKARHPYEDLKFYVLLSVIIVGVFFWSVSPIVTVSVFLAVAVMFIVFWGMLDRGQENYSET